VLSLKQAVYAVYERGDLHEDLYYNDSNVGFDAYIRTSLCRRFLVGNKDVGTELYDNAFLVHDTSMKTEAVHDERFALSDDDVIASLEAKNDVGSRIYADAYEKGDLEMADRGVKGSAAGGMVKDDEITKIWDNLLGAPADLICHNWRRYF